jgi:hypothetical protein
LCEERRELCHAAGIRYDGGNQILIEALRGGR